MECVKDKKELRSLTPDVIFNRLMQLHAEMMSPAKLPKNLVEESPLRPYMVFSTNIKTLTEEEIRSANMYLSATLLTIKNKYLANSIKPPYEATQAAAWAYEILAQHIPWRRYQEALVLWLWGSSSLEGRRISPPKESADREIDVPIAKAIAPKLDGSVMSVPKILEKTIEDAMVINDVKTAKKAASLLLHVKQSLDDYKNEQGKKRVDVRFLERMASRLRDGEYGKVTIRDGYIELNTSDPNFIFNPKLIQSEPNGGKFGKRSSLLYIQTRIIADDMGFNSDKMELIPVISSDSNSCIKIEFSLIDKK